MPATPCAGVGDLDNPGVEQVACDYPLKIQVFRSVRDEWVTIALYCDFHFGVAVWEDRVNRWDRVCRLAPGQEPYDRLPREGNNGDDRTG